MNLDNLEAITSKYKKIYLVPSELEETINKKIEPGDIALGVRDDMAGCLAELYRMYEFSDNIVLLECGAYPTIWNYVCSGILTKEEAVQALML